MVLRKRIVAKSLRKAVPVCVNCPLRVVMGGEVHLINRVSNSVGKPCDGQPSRMAWGALTVLLKEW
jgi:hypothetical protein